MGPCVALIRAISITLGCPKKIVAAVKDARARRVLALMSDPDYFNLRFVVARAKACETSGINFAFRREARCASHCHIWELLCVRHWRRGCR